MKATTEMFWPREILDALKQLDTISLEHSFILMFAVALDCTDGHDRQLAIQLSPHTSQSPHLAQMCADVAELFMEISEKFRKEGSVIQ